MIYPLGVHLIIQMFHTSFIPFISSDQYITPNLYNIPNMRFFLLSIYLGPDLGHHTGNRQKHNKTPHTREPRGQQALPSRRPHGQIVQARKHDKHETYEGRSKSSDHCLVASSRNIFEKHTMHHSKDLVFTFIMFVWCLATHQPLWVISVIRY